MPSVSRLTDLWAGICCCHPPIPCIPMAGPIITASHNAESGNLKVARLTDVVMGYCGHTGTIVTASASNITNNLGKARIGDSVTGCTIGNLITGNSRHIDEDMGGGGALALTTTIEFQSQDITYTEVDYGNTDDESEIDDGYNVFPPVVGLATQEQIAKSNDLDVSPTVDVEDSVDPALDDSTAVTNCLNVPIPPPPSFQLSTNFTLGDVSSNAVLSKTAVRAQHGLSIEDIVCNLQALCENVLEPISSQYGRSNLIITSGFRAGGSTSQHERGQAADIQFPLKSNTEVYNIAKWIRDNVSFDQLILEYGGNKPWIHASYKREGNRPLTASNKFGTRVSPGNYVWLTLKNMA